MRRIGLVLAVSLALLAGTAAAGTISISGAVTALTDVSDVGNVVGTASFQLLPDDSIFPLNTYSAAGMDLEAGAFNTILPGIVSSGTAYAPRSSTTLGVTFPGPIAGGGSTSGTVGKIGMVATFSIPITQWGATFSRNGTQYITAWASDGSLIGQVMWAPSSDSSFVGIDTGGVPIAMLSLGNDDVFGGATYDVGGYTTIWDNAKWGDPIPEPSTFALVGLVAGVFLWRRRRSA